MYQHIAVLAKGIRAAAPVRDALMREAEVADAVIIGSGAGGATAAWRLARHGLRVMLIERGARLHPDPGAASVGRYLYHELRDPAGALAYVGGATKFYGAALYRFRESDFACVAHESGVSPAWPFGYAELAPYYAEAEQLYRVHGAVGDDPTEPPRAAAYPHPALPQHPIMGAFADGLRRAGVHPSPIPRGLDFGPEGRCVLCATCDAHYCQRDAKWDAETAALAAAAGLPNFTLRSETECVQIRTDAAGRRVTGVRLRDAGGECHIRAGRVIVSAGLPGSALLLRRSRNAAHPEGLGNHAGALGRHLGGHAVGMVFPLLSRRPLPAFHSKDFAVHDFYHGAPDWAFPLGVIQTGGQTPFWETAPRWQRRAAEWIGRRSLICFTMGEALPTAASGFGFEGDAMGPRTAPQYNLRSFEKLRAITVALFRRAGYRSIARRRAPYLWHETGTARMGDDPANSVVDRHCEVHGIAGLYVVDASVLPSAGAVNTGLTIMALALRAADHIAAGGARATAESRAA